jgi:hypothetical protein
LSCRATDKLTEPAVVRFHSLVDTPQNYNGQLVCTHGVSVSSFEASGLASATREDAGGLHLTEPVIWLEGARLLSQTGCFTTSTVPAYEFCEVTVCGRFEYGGRYGHLGAYAYQLSGAALPLLPIQGTYSRYIDAAAGFAVDYPSVWQVTRPMYHSDDLGRSWMTVEFTSPLYACGHPAYDRYTIRVAVAERVSETVTETANLSLDPLPPGLRDQVRSHCCLAVGGEKGLELLGFPPTRWGNRQLLILHEGWEYRLDFYPQTGLMAETEAAATARRAVERLFAYVCLPPDYRKPLPVDAIGRTRSHTHCILSCPGRPNRVPHPTGRKSYHATEQSPAAAPARAPPVSDES